MAPEQAALIHKPIPKVGHLSPPTQTGKPLSKAEAIGRVPDLIRQFYGVLGELQSLFPRQFTPEGCLDQSMSDVLAAISYRLELVESRAKVSLAKTSAGRVVQLKVTRSRKGTVGLFERPEWLLVVQLSGDDLLELYNGPAALAWEKAGKTRKNGERRIPVSRLKCLGQSVPMDRKASSTGFFA